VEELIMARLDLNELMKPLVPFAQEMLAKHGEFYPFGAAMSVAGKVSLTEAYTGTGHPPSQEVIDLLVDGFRAQAAKKEVRAVGICIDVRTLAPGQTEKTDAICVRLRHADSESLDVFLPYQKDKSGAIQYGKLFATQGDQDIFG
jgi:hypothetical protein